jgi:hypothetical protein
MQRLDVPRAESLVAQRPAQLLDAGRERGIADRRSPPDRVEQFFLADDAVAVLNEKTEQRQRPRRQSHVALAVREAHLRIQAERPERKALI